MENLVFLMKVCNSSQDKGKDGEREKKNFFIFLFKEMEMIR